MVTIPRKMGGKNDIVSHETRAFCHWGRWWSRSSLPRVDFQWQPAELLQDHGCRNSTGLDFLTKKCWPSSWIQTVIQIGSSRQVSEARGARGFVGTEIGNFQGVVGNHCLSHRIHGAAIYGNMDPINIPPILAYIPYMDPMGMCYCLLGNRMTVQGVVISLQTSPGIEVCPQVEPNPTISAQHIEEWLVGGDWNHGILNDFPETVGNGIIIPTDDSSIIFQRGRSTTNQMISPKTWKHQACQAMCTAAPLCYGIEFSISDDPLSGHGMGN